LQRGHLDGWALSYPVRLSFEIAQTA